MKTIKGFISLALLFGLIYAVVQGFVIAGWKGAGIVLVFLFFFVGLSKGLADLLLSPFTRQQGD